MGPFLFPSVQEKSCQKRVRGQGDFDSLTVRAFGNSFQERQNRLRDVHGDFDIHEGQDKSNQSLPQDVKFTCLFVRNLTSVVHWTKGSAYEKKLFQGQLF